MQRSWRAWSVTVLATAALLVALADMALVLTNHTARRQTDEQRQYIQQTVQLNGVSETLVREMARAAIEGKDQALHDLLVSHGFHIQAEQPPPPGQPSAPVEKK